MSHSSSFFFPHLMSCHRCYNCHLLSLCIIRSSYLMLFLFLVILNYVFVKLIVHFSYFPLLSYQGISQYSFRVCYRFRDIRISYIVRLCQSIIYLVSSRSLGIISMCFSNVSPFLCNRELSSIYIPVSVVSKINFSSL